MSKEEAEQVVDDILTRAVGTFVDPNGSFRTKLIKKALGEYSKDIVIKFGIDPTRPDIHLGHAVVLRKLRKFQDLGCKVVFLVGDFTAQIGDPTGKSKVRPEIDQKEMVENIQSFVGQIPKILKIDPQGKDEEKNIIRDASGFIVDSPWFAWMRNAEWFQGVTDISAEGASKEIREFQTEKGPIFFEPNSFMDKAVIYDRTRIQTSPLARKGVLGVTFINVMSILRGISFSQLIERDMFQERLKTDEQIGRAHV